MGRWRRRRQDPGGSTELPVEFADPLPAGQAQRLRVDHDGITAIQPDRPDLHVPWQHVARFGPLHDAGGARMIGMVLTDAGLDALGLPRPAATGDHGYHALLPSLHAYGRQQDELAHYLEQLRAHVTGT